MSTWTSQDSPPEYKISPVGWVRVALRLALLVLLFSIGLLIFLGFRATEVAFAKGRRKTSPFVVKTVCRLALIIVGLPLKVTGTPFEGAGACVANHSSWLDILVLNSVDRVFFVSKAEVSDWPAIGFMARVVGTVFIRRAAKDAALQRDLFEERLGAGHRLLFFPEGTSSDGLQVLPFRSTLFAAFFSPTLKDEMHIQPVSVSYAAPSGMDPRTYGWWGDMDFAPHMLGLLALGSKGHALVTFHPALRVADYPDRKALSAACEAAVRAGHVTTPAGRSKLAGQP